LPFSSIQLGRYFQAPLSTTQTILSDCLNLTVLHSRG
jgi:hypothetical protein